MSLLAHATCAVYGFEKERKALIAQGQREIQEAKRLQKELGCTWDTALRLAYQRMPSGGTDGRITPA